MRWIPAACFALVLSVAGWVHAAEPGELKNPWARAPAGAAPQLPPEPVSGGSELRDPFTARTPDAAGRGDGLKNPFVRPPRPVAANPAEPTAGELKNPFVRRGPAGATPLRAAVPLQRPRAGR